MYLFVRGNWRCTEVEIVAQERARLGGTNFKRKKKKVTTLQI